MQQPQNMGAAFAACFAVGKRWECVGELDIVVSITPMMPCNTPRYTYK